MSCSSLLAFARYDEIANIRPCEIKFNVDHISIKIPRNKGDQLRQGDEVIARTDSITCLIAMLNWYVVKAKMPVDSSLFLFAQ